MEELPQGPAATRVWLLRHAESADPTVFHGAESDIGLSPLGYRQARAIAEVLVEMRPAAIVSSGMRRARETAEPIAAATGAPLRIEPELHERRVGSLSGQAFQADSGIWRETLHRWMEGETDYAPEGAESFDAIRDRVLPVWKRLTGEYAQRSLVVVAHGVVCKVLLFSLVAGLSARDWKRIGPIRNVGITELLSTGSAWQLARFNEVPEGIASLASPGG